MTDIMIGRNGTAGVNLDPHHGHRRGMIAGERAIIRPRSPVGAKYDGAINRQSAAEMLARPASDKAAHAATVAADAPAKGGVKDNDAGWDSTVHDALSGARRRQGVIGTMGKQRVRRAGSQLGRQILRGALGGMFGGRH